MGYTFISYVHENRAKVLQICSELTRRGFNIWIDVNDLKPGAPWPATIRRAIQNADFFLAFFSREFYTKDRSHMHEEIVLAIDQLRKMPFGRIWFIPVRLSGDIPDRSIGAGQTLRDIQYADLEKEPEKDIERIFQWLQSKSSS